MTQFLRTPLIPLRSSDPEIEGRIFMKAENLQLFGSYKIRGVAAVIERATPDELQNGLHAVSAGNMAQAVAFAARQRGLKCRIDVPDSAPEIKKNAIRELGAELREKPFQEIWKLINGETAPADPGLFIHPSLNANLLLGYGSIADELVSDLPDVEAVVIPFGLGGLSLGLARRLRELRPLIAIYLVEPETAHPFKISLQNGCASKVDRRPSFVDAIGTPEVLSQVFQSLFPFVQDSLVVDLSTVRAAIRYLHQRHKLVCEGAGAASLAAALPLAKAKRHKKIACILSGGNLDPTVLYEILSEKISE